MTHEEYIAHDALGLAECVVHGDVRPTELLELALERARALDPDLNAIVHWMEDDARAAADSPAPGPFRGVPYLAKDLIGQYAGHPTSAGSALLRDLVADHDTELVRRTKAAGLVVFGKTNLPELGLVPFTEPRLFGPCHNPWDLDRSPGGSSGGSAAAVAAGIVPMAGGGDGGGSIRIPASCCGLFGLKPTRARTPTGPDYGLLWQGATVEHVLTRSVRDSAAMLDATHGPDAGAPFEIPPPAAPYLSELEREPGRLRIAWTARPPLEADVHPDCVAAVEDAARLLEELGHDVVEAAPPVDAPSFARAFLTMITAELAADFEDYRRLTGRAASRRQVEPATWAAYLVSRAFTAPDYAVALRTLERIGRDVGRFFTDVDVLVTPTLALPPPRIGTLGPSRFEERGLTLLGMLGSGRLLKGAGMMEQAARDTFAYMPFTPVFNVTGQPAMSVPLFWNADGLPIGTHIVGRFGREDTLFCLAAQLERARPWFKRVPELARRLVGAASGPKDRGAPRAES